MIVRDFGLKKYGIMLVSKKIVCYIHFTKILSRINSRRLLMFVVATPP
jgi:hypothetical protein